MEQLLAEIVDAGWSIYSIHEEPNHPTPWTCHLRRMEGPNPLIAYGQGSSIEEALEMALIATPKVELAKPVSFKIIGEAFDLRSALNLRPKFTDRREF